MSQAQEIIDSDGDVWIVDSNEQTDVNEVNEDNWSSKKGMIYLKATDKETFDAAVAESGWTYEVESEQSDSDAEPIVEVSYYTAAHSLDVIGVIHAETGNMLTEEDSDGETFEYPEMEAIDGWHANLLLHGEELPASLEPFVIDAPSNPHRKFA